MFAEFLEAKGKGAGRRFHPDARIILKRVKDLYAEGFNQEQIAGTLRLEFSVIVDASETGLSLPSVQSLGRFRDVLEHFAQEQQKANEQIGMLRQEIVFLRSENEEMRSFIDERMGELERQFIEAKTQLLETTQAQIAAAQEKRPWWKLWG